jgi:DNA-binding transcriptional LysR family regulator
MQNSDSDLLAWANKHAGLSTVTLGQLAKLLELSTSTSVASMSHGAGDPVSQAVGDRQKLWRLTKGLSLGDLTCLEKKSTRVTKVGQQLAYEVRHLLTAIRSLAEERAPRPWRIAAGDSWLQCCVLPALDLITSADRKSRFEAINLDAEAMRSALRSGKVDFALMRKGEANEISGFESSTPMPVEGYTLLTDPKDKRDLPSSPMAKIRWLVDRKRKLIQHGRSWPDIFKALQGQQKETTLLKLVVPHVACDTHIQAAVAVSDASQSWAIVPTLVAKRFANEAQAGSFNFKSPALSEELVLVVCSRAIGPLPDWQKVKGELRRVIGNFCSKS